MMVVTDEGGLRVRVESRIATLWEEVPSASNERLQEIHKILVGLDDIRTRFCEGPKDLVEEMAQLY